MKYSIIFSASFATCVLSSPIVVPGEPKDLVTRSPTFGGLGGLGGYGGAGSVGGGASTGASAKLNFGLGGNFGLANFIPGFGGPAGKGVTGKGYGAGPLALLRPKGGFGGKGSAYSDDKGTKKGLKGGKGGAGLKGKGQGAVAVGAAGAVAVPAAIAPVVPAAPVAPQQGASGAVVPVAPAGDDWAPAPTPLEPLTGDSGAIGGGISADASLSGSVAVLPVDSSAAPAVVPDPSFAPVDTPVDTTPTAAW